MKVSVIIINYNTVTLTSGCIRSVIEHTSGIDYEIILVDNASTECDPLIFLKEFPKIILVRNSMNTGFAGGNNLGLQKSTGDFLLLLNSDTILTENSILKTVEYFKTLKNAGVMGCRMIFPNGRIQFTARRFRSIRWELLDLFRFIPFLMPYQKRSQLMLGKYFRHDKSTDCDWVNGAFFLFTKKILLQLQDQKLDDRFFMYGEDQLWCEQIRHLGYRIIFYAGTTIVHINSGSTEKSKQLNLRKIMMQHEIEIMQIRKGKGFYYYVFKIIFLIKENSRNLIKSVIFWFTSRQIR